MQLKPLDEMFAEGGEWHGLDADKALEKIRYAVGKGGGPQMSVQDILLHLERSIDWVYQSIISMLLAADAGVEGDEQAQEIMTEAMRRYEFQKLARLYDTKMAQQQRAAPPKLIVPQAHVPKDL